jgi:RNA polymerase-binding transcription factor
MLSRKTRQHHRALEELLETRGRELQRGLRALLSGPADPVEVKDPEDLGRSSWEQELDLVLIEMKAETCRRIDEALQRLDDGTYGLCEDCDDPIPDARLHALPFATLCRPCQESREAPPETEHRFQPAL